MCARLEEAEDKDREDQSTGQRSGHGEGKDAKEEDIRDRPTQWARPVQVSMSGGFKELRQIVASAGIGVRVFADQPHPDDALNQVLKDQQQLQQSARGTMPDLFAEMEARHRTEPAPSLDDIFPPHTPASSISHKVLTDFQSVHNAAPMTDDDLLSFLRR